jgi:hypothetical protein
MTKLFEAAKLTGTLVQAAAVKVAKDIALEEDKKMLLNASDKKLRHELAKTDRELISLVNRESFSTETYSELSERRSFIAFLIAPYRFQGNASIG